MAYGPAKREAWRTLNLEMGATNRAAIDAARAVVAVLDGTDVDSGTAAEIGYAFASGKLIVGYRGDFRLSADNEGEHRQPAGRVLHPGERGDHRRALRGSRAGARLPPPAGTGRDPRKAGGAAGARADRRSRRRVR